MDKKSISEKIERLLTEHDYNDLNYLLDCMVKRTHGLEQLKAFAEHPEYQALLSKTQPKNELESALRKSSIELLERIEHRTAAS